MSALTNPFAFAKVARCRFTRIFPPGSKPMLDPALTTQIMAEVDRRFDDQIKGLADLVKIPSVRYREAPAQDMMARLFKEDGRGVDRWQIHIDDPKHLPRQSQHAQEYDHACNVS